MPLYIFECTKCQEKEETILSIANRDNERVHNCGLKMNRVMTLSLPPIMKQTGNDMALNSLNSRETSHMKPEFLQRASTGLEKPERKIW